MLKHFTSAVKTISEIEWKERNFEAWFESFFFVCLATQIFWLGGVVDVLWPIYLRHLNSFRRSPLANLTGKLSRSLFCVNFELQFWPLLGRFTFQCCFAIFSCCVCFLCDRSAFVFRLIIIERWKNENYGNFPPERFNFVV